MVSGVQAFAEVVEQESEAENSGFAIFFHEPVQATWKITSLSRECVDDAEGYQGVFVDGIPMVEVANHEAVNVLPLWYDGREHARFLHFSKRGCGMRLAEELAPSRPGKALVCEEVPNDLLIRSQSPLRIPGELQTMAADKGEGFENGFSGARDSGRIAEKQTFPSDRELPG